MMRCVAFLFLFALAGCGLAPAIDGQTATRLAQIKVAPIAERQGQVLNAALRRELDPTGRNIPPAYDLQLTLTTSLANSFSSASGTFRARATMQAAGALRDGQGQIVWQGTARQASLVAQEDQPSLSAQAAEDLWEDLAKLLARDLKLQLARALSR